MTTTLTEIQQDQAREIAFRHGYEDCLHQASTHIFDYLGTEFEYQYNFGYGYAQCDIREGVTERIPYVPVDAVLELLPVRVGRWYRARHCATRQAVRNG